VAATFLISQGGIPRSRTVSLSAPPGFRHREVVALRTVVTNRLRRRWAARLTLLLTAPLWLDGCVSVGIDRSKREGQDRGAATLEVRIYETPSDLRSGVLTSRKIVSELVRTDVSPEQRIYRGVDPTWTRSDLSPGRYRLTAVAVLDETPAEKPLPNQDSERFRLRAGESVRATILLKRAPVGAIAGVSAGVAAAIIAAVVIASLSFLDIELTLLPESSTPPPYRIADPDRTRPIASHGD
jgi:hypothetical protein